MTRALALLAFAALLPLALQGCGEDVRTVQLAFVDRDPNACSCVDAAGERLLNRARDARASVVVDFLRTPLRFCQVTETIRQCRDPGCPALPELRRCYDVVAEGPLESDLDVLRAVEASLRSSGEPVLLDAPDESVIVRATVTTQTCAAVEEGAPLGADQLLACALSCPVDLGQYEGVLDLDLPTTLESCTIQEVAVCAFLDRLPPE